MLTAIPWQGKQLLHTTWRDFTEKQQAETQRRSLEAQFQQVVMNLVTNASDALGDRAGSITLRTGLAELDSRAIALNFAGDDLAPGPFLTLEVSDTGCGMTQAVISRIFDPFFTTKQTGRGLGLSARLGILRGHHAGLRIRSQVEQGSSFKVYFPAAAGHRNRAQPPEPALEAKCQATVLLVKALRKVIQDSQS